MALWNQLPRFSDGGNGFMKWTMPEKLKAPFPWFGGKSMVASIVWKRLGNVDNYIEPFAGSLAVLLGRPSPPKVETVNDLDCYVANFWRATSRDPEAVADAADWPVNETDLHSRHRWLVLSDGAAFFRQRMREDPDYFDPKIAGWWCWGLCCWIGAGWCVEPGGNTHGPAGGSGKRLPDVGNQSGRGIHAKGPAAKTPCSDRRGALRAGNRPQLADAYSRGRGVNGNDAAESCANRRAFVLDWMQRLRDRLRVVRVCCGGWSRVCDSPSTTTRLGTTGVFLDPPYGAKAGRDDRLYAVDSLSVADEVRAWCLKHGDDRLMRISLCGYAGEGHEKLESHGWGCVAWKAHGGYGNRSDKGKENAAKERIWFSPHCLNEPTLFDRIAHAE